MRKKQTWEKPELEFHAAGTEGYRRLKALLEEEESEEGGRQAGAERNPAGGEPGRG